MPGNASRMVWKAAERLTEMIVSQISGVASASVTVRWTPALLTSTSGPPQAARSRIITSIAATWRMSASKKRTSGAPAARTSAVAASTWAASASPCSATRAPAEAIAFAIESPIPCTDPVTSAVLPSRNLFIVLPLLRCVRYRPSSSQSARGVRQEPVGGPQVGLPRRHGR